MVIRHATDDDLEAVLGIFNDAILHTTAVFHYEPHTLDMRRSWFRAKRADNWPVWVADEGGIVQGFSTFGPFRPWPAYHYTVEHSVYVAATARGRGLGSALVRTVLDEARRRELHTVVGGVVAENVASLRLHEALGFVEVAHFRQVGFKFGRWLDLKFLQVVFDGPGSPRDGTPPPEPVQ
ncbi:MAG: N-acetyltransferase family protein [Vicinamibacterales bacterium]